MTYLRNIEKVINKVKRVKVDIAGLATGCSTSTKHLILDRFSSTP